MFREYHQHLRTVAPDVEVPVEVTGPGSGPSDLLPPEPPGDGGVGDGGG